MTRLPHLASGFLLLALVAAGAAAEPVSASRGVWSGAMAEPAASWPGGGGKIELRVEGTDKRFTVNLLGPGGLLLAGEVQAREREGVFGPPAASGLKSFFGGSSPVKPLEGQPLTWARRTGEELIVYRLEVREGPYRLDRVRLKPTGDRVEIAFERREHERPPARFSATLGRQR